MRAIHVIGIVGEGSHELMGHMAHILPGIPIAAHRSAEIVDFIDATVDMVDELMETGLSDLAGAIESAPMVLYVPDFSQAVEESILSEAREGLHVATLATEPGHEHRKAYIGRATDAIPALQLLAKRYDVRV